MGNKAQSRQLTPMTYHDLAFLKGRGVEHFVHFTAISNLKNIVKRGLVPRAVLEKEGVDFAYNDDNRYDGKEHINLSITRPNNRLFYVMRKRYPERRYAILTINPAILGRFPKEGSCSYRFVAVNAASSSAMSCNVEQMFVGGRSS